MSSTKCPKCGGEVTEITRQDESANGYDNVVALACTECNWSRSTLGNRPRFFVGKKNGKVRVK